MKIKVSRAQMRDGEDCLVIGCIVPGCGKSAFMIVGDGTYCREHGEVRMLNCLWDLSQESAPAAVAQTWHAWLKRLIDAVKSGSAWLNAGALVFVAGGLAYFGWKWGEALAQWLFTGGIQ